MTTLFDPMNVGDIALSNRIVMAPLTRNRSPGAVPSDLAVTYYTQRATAGLLITEATAISHQGQGYADVPGLYGPNQLVGWKRVTDSVHAAGGKIVTQLWHVGRISHETLQPNGGKPVAPSPITAKSKTYLVKPDGSGEFAPTSEPRALDRGELPGIGRLVAIVPSGSRMPSSGLPNAADGARRSGPGSTTAGGRSRTTSSSG